MTGETETIVIPNGNVRLRHVVYQTAKAHQRPQRDATNAAVEYGVHVEPSQLVVERVRMGTPRDDPVK